jgi:TPR repeat protein
VKGAVLTDDKSEVLPLGDMGDGDLYCAVGRTPYGSIPGRALNDQFTYVYEGEAKCWPETAGISLSYVGPRVAPLDIAAAEVRAKARTLQIACLASPIRRKNLTNSSVVLFWQAKALYETGMGYANGTSGSPSECYRYFLEASELGYAPAQYAMAYYCYYSGYYCGDYSQAYRYFEMAAEQNHREAVYMAGDFNYYGRLCGTDMQKAKEFLSRPVLKYHSRAKPLLAEIVRAEEEKQHAEDQVNQVRASADGGDAAAQLQMARYLEWGNNVVNSDQGKGLEYLRLAADQGLASAQLWLAQSYDNARFGLAEDDAVALEWYRKAADQLSPAEMEELQAKKDSLR